jgi:hypothetical protein
MAAAIDFTILDNDAIKDDCEDIEFLLTELD